MNAPRILLIDSYDSFAYNVADALACAGGCVRVVPVGDAVNTMRRGGYDAVVLGPGPGTPVGNDPLLRTVGECRTAGVPVLGICLGLQAIAAFYGGRVVLAPQPVHGEAANVHHRGSRLFAGIPSPFRATRYHSLCVAPATLPAALQVSATSEDGVVQAIEDRAGRTFGLQFHPESFLSEYGAQLFHNFIGCIGSPAC